ncbi:MAG: acetoacetate--CoA ligase [Alphaproteobacteria bacterium]|nr:acetoacetate--CoA ligase [Alphaproteobacteria bacterium]
MSEPVWRPSPARIAAANLTRFRAAAATAAGTALPDFAALHRWSIADPAAFWRLVWSEGGVIAETQGSVALADGDRMPGARFFPGARLNFAENLLRRRDAALAMIFRGEAAVNRALSFAALYDLVSRIAQGLEAAGVREGDRVAGYLPNIPEAIAAMLAASSLGAVWSSCSPDFGTAGVLDRFGQIAPTVLFVPDRYYYNGKPIEMAARTAEVVAGLPSVRRVVVVPYDGASATAGGLATATTLADFIAPFAARTIPFRRLPFDHPLYILFSSGTTGVPKCIVHGAGGTLLQHIKEHRLHTDVRRDDRVFYFTTLGWMMWNWLVSALACEATLLLYDGSPFHPDANAVFDFAQETGMTHLGTSAKFIDAARKAGIRPIATHRLPALRAILSTGSPLVAESFDWVYEAIKTDVHLASISGGTDIVSCFVLGDPTAPVWRGEIQARGLGMAVESFDDDGRPLHREKGELVCTRPFPSMPIGFWNDPDGARYRAAYFERFAGIWCHGDMAEITAAGGVVIHGRSDAVLNPGGVRIGTAEIYRQVEQIDEVEESLACSQEWQGDVRVVLFVKLRPGVALDDALADRIRRRIRDNASPRHVPARLLQVPDIPRTKSGKIVELAVRETIHGRPVKNVEALANPEALAFFRDRAELRT